MSWSTPERESNISLHPYRQRCVVVLSYSILCSKKTRTTTHSDNFVNLNRVSETFSTGR